MAEQMHKMTPATDQTLSPSEEDPHALFLDCVSRLSCTDRAPKKCEEADERIEAIAVVFLSLYMISILSILTDYYCWCKQTELWAHGEELMNELRPAIAAVLSLSGQKLITDLNAGI